MSKMTNRSIAYLLIVVIVAFIAGAVILNSIEKTVLVEEQLGIGGTEPAGNAVAPVDPDILTPEEENLEELNLKGIDPKG